jgi:hypothetical protein
LVDGLGASTGAKEAASNALCMGIGGHFQVFGALFRELMILGVAQETGATIGLNCSD